MPSDKELIDALEQFIKREPLTLWLGVGVFPGGSTSGLSLITRTLREALALLIPAKAEDTDARK